jgi:S1-C subfamily serine protease
MLGRWGCGLAVVTALVSGAGLGAQPPRPPRAALGVMVAPAPEGAEKPGLLVGDVPPTSPAAQAGIRRGDLIVKAGDRDVRNMADIMAVLAQHQPGDKVEVKVIRDGQEKNLSVTLGDRFASLPPSSEGPSRPQAPAVLGIQTQNLTPGLKNQLGVKADHGVLVAEVGPNTPAAKAGLQQEDVITAVNGKKVANAEELREAIRQAGVGKKVSVSAERAKEQKEFTVQLEAAPAGGLLERQPLPPFRQDGPFPGPGFPGGVFLDQNRMEQLEKQVRDLENRVRELEKRQTPKNGE